MKFSVLLPTRNRLDYLKYAIETVRRQEYDDWEIIISDNFSEDDIAGYVRSLNEARIKYYRTESFLPVTDNWNLALSKSTGDYVIMLGDDDCLMNGYFKTMSRLIEEYDEPDCIYTSAFLYAYPNVMPGSPQGYLQPYGYASFLQNAREPYLLDKRSAFELVREMMNFRVLFGFNMQFSTVSRKFIDSLREKGKFFQSAFPDYYATNVMFLKAERILVCPTPLVTIGITPKSYGFFHFNKREATGIEFLGSRPDPQILDRLRRVLLPGTNINTGWLFAAETIKHNYGSEFKLRVNYRRYRLLQVLNIYENYYMEEALSKQDVDELHHMLRPWETLIYRGTMSCLSALNLLRMHRLYRSLTFRTKSRLHKFLRQIPEWRAEVIQGNFKNILEVFEHVNPTGAAIDAERAGVITGSPV